MNEDEKAIIQAVVHEAAVPFTGVVADIVGIAGGDTLKAFWARKQERLEKNEREVLDAAGKVLENRGKKPDPDTSPEIVEEILDAGGNCGTKELRDVFGKLLAAAADPNRRTLYRLEFLDIAKNMESIDVLVLPFLANSGGMSPTRVAVISSRLSRSEDEVLLSFRNLEKLERVDSKDTTMAWSHRPKITPLGRQFRAAVAD
jgi:hypothetical protein